MHCAVIMGAKWSKVVKNGIKCQQKPSASHSMTTGGVSVTGEFQHNLDSKGRLFIPARLKEELGSVFYVTLSSEKCLHAYSSEAWAAFSEKVNAMPYIKQQKMRPLFAFAARCELDTQGRILIPQNLRDYAGLSKNVTVVGSNNHAEFWDSDTWSGIHAIEMTPENIRAVMEELDF